MKFFVIFQYDAFGAPMEFEKFDAYRDALGRFMCQRVLPRQKYLHRRSLP